MKKTNYKYVPKSEVEAYHILRKAGEMPLTTSNQQDFSEAGNKIIELAERIKAERSAMTLNRG